MVSKLKKIGLGTVQFGLDYGVSNNSGKTSFKEVEDILTAAKCHGVGILDTAQGYGDSESVLGKVGVAGFDVITKITKDGELEESLDRLKLDSVYGLFAHNATELTESEYLWKKFVNYKKQGLVEKIGASVYNAQQIDAVLDNCDIDIIQLPINVYDQRLLQSGHLRRLAERGIEIHARSVFLQGLLLMDAEELPEYFNSIKSTHIKYRAFLKENYFTPVQGALEFLYAIEEIDNIILGVNNLEQFNQLLEINCLGKVNLDEYKAFANNTKQIVEPVNWKQ